MPIIMLLVFIIICILVVIMNKVSPVKMTEPYLPIPSDKNSMLLLLINEEREKNGLSKLIPEELLISICEEKCDDMIKTKTVNHDNFSDRFVKSQSISLLENVGYGYSTDNSLFNAYMKSSGHRDNILSKNSTHIGIHTESSYNCCLFARY